MGLASFRRLIRSRHLTWLLAVVLWLPAAQWAAATHALLHVNAALAEAGDPPGHHLPSTCDTCVVLASIGGAAPAAESAASLPPPPPQARPAAPVPRSADTPRIAAYRSRAPPSLPV